MMMKESRYWMRCFSTALALLLLLASPAMATWSIIIVDTETGEIAIGCATCVKNIDLKKACSVVVVGKGASNAQAWADSTGQNRTTMSTGFLNDLTAVEIYDQLALTDPGFQSHQYGIVDINGGALSHQGTKSKSYTGAFTGKSGSIVYAIQGNVLAGQGVLYAAEDAVLSTPGDVGQRLMAGMEAARSYGGDGRCSCMEWNPTICGCPPEEFNKSAHVGYMVVTRPGDVDGTFMKETGFANGDYFMDLNVTVNSPVDPVTQMQGMYDDFRASLVGRPDHYLSLKVIDPESIVADKKTSAELMIQVVDINNDLITHGGATVTVVHDKSSAGCSAIGPVNDHGDGTYSVSLEPYSYKPGTDIFLVTVDDGSGPVVLSPSPTLEVQAPTLLASEDKISAILGTATDLYLLGDPSCAGAPYLIMGTTSGTDPGFMVNGVQIPLNPDLFTYLLIYYNTVFPASLGALNVNGLAVAPFDPEPLWLVPYVGLQISFAWITLMPMDYASTPISIEVVP